MGDGQDPRPEVGISPQPGIRPEGREERLLETILCLIPADQGHQESIHILSMRIEELLKRWKPHSQLNASATHRVRSLGRWIQPEGLSNAPGHPFGEWLVQAVFRMTESRGKHEAFRLPGSPVEPVGFLDVEEVVVCTVDEKQRDRGDPFHNVLGMLGLAPGVRQPVSGQPGHPSAAPGRGDLSDSPHGTRGVPVPPRGGRDRYHGVHSSAVRSVTKHGDPTHGDTHRDHGALSLFLGESNHGLDVQVLEIPVCAQPIAGPVSPEVERVDDEPVGHVLHECHHLGLAVPTEESMTEDQRRTLRADTGTRKSDAVLGRDANRGRRELVPSGEQPSRDHDFVDYPRPRPVRSSVTLTSLRRIVFLTDPPPDEVLPAAMLLGADVKTESLSADSLARLPDLAPEFLIVDAMTDPERAFGLLSALSAAGSAVPVIMVVFPDGVQRHPWHEVADDFIFPNATEAELGLRLEMIRARRGDSGQEVIRLGPVTINVETYQAMAAGRPLDLTYKEFELLRYLAQNPGRVFTRASLLREVWGYDFYGGTRTVDVHIRRLRAKLGPEHEHLIETVRGVGYRATQPVG